MKRSSYTSLYTSFYTVGLLLWGLSSILIGCGTASQSTAAHGDSPSVTQADDAGAPPFGEDTSALGFAAEQPIRNLFPLFIAEERIAIADRDLAKLGLLWDVDGLIIDQRGTKDTEDDYIWRGRSAILDRYEIAVFRFSPPLIEPPTDLLLSCDAELPLSNLTLNCVEDEIADGTVIYASREGDRWQFLYSAERWWIKELRYNP